MSAETFEAFLARLYVDPAARARFEANPEGEAGRAGLSAEERRSLLDIDRVGLELASRSFALKRRRSEICSSQHPSFLGRLAERALGIALRGRR
jgi:hypothetical protein